MTPHGWAVLQQFLSWLLPSGGVSYLLGSAVWNRRKAKSGRLIRANAANLAELRAKRAEAKAAAYLAYIWVLRARYPKGTSVPRWPTGLKPKE